MVTGCSKRDQLGSPRGIASKKVFWCHVRFGQRIQPAVHSAGDAHQRQEAWLISPDVCATTMASHAFKVVRNGFRPSTELTLEFKPPLKHWGLILQTQPPLFDVDPPVVNMGVLPSKSGLNPH